MAKSTHLCAHKPAGEGVGGSGPCVMTFSARDSALVREAQTDGHRQQSDGVESWPLSSECGTGDTAALPGPQVLPAHLFTSSLL